nr:MAG TPA: hypothetical protein [Caudoviricetes sp.]
MTSYFIYNIIIIYFMREIKFIFCTFAVRKVPIKVEDRESKT